MLKNHDNNTKLLLDLSNKGRRAFTLPECDVPSQEITDKDNLISNINLPEVSQLDLVRYFTNLSQKNFSIDTNFYPLGSCTMKYNPKINVSIAMMREFSGAHPLQDVSSIQGILKVYYDLGELLCKITEMDGITLQPSAGSQGEFVGLLLMKKYHEIKKNKSKKYIIIPKTAHGTNPASVIMSGYLIKQVDSDDRGRVCIKHLKELVDDETAGMMLTQPNTLGLFEDNI